MFEGETILSGAPSECRRPKCRKPYVWRIHQTGGGWAIWTFTQCSHGDSLAGEPYSRESEYYPSEEAAREAFRTLTFGRGGYVAKYIDEKARGYLMLAISGE